MNEPEVIRNMLGGPERAPRTLAVIGLSDNPGKPSFYVSDYMLSHGFRILPVNPALESVLWARNPTPRSPICLSNRMSSTSSVCQSSFRPLWTEMLGPRPQKPLGPAGDRPRRSRGPRRGRRNPRRHGPLHHDRTRRAERLLLRWLEPIHVPACFFEEAILHTSPESNSRKEK